jgi:hypothetical protein
MLSGDDSTTRRLPLLQEWSDIPVFVGRAGRKVIGEDS